MELLEKRTISKLYDWQKKRTQLNHDWLQNQFLLACRKMINILEGMVEDESFEDRFINFYLEEWENKSWEIKDLIQNFESQMSPVNLFKKYPLNGLPDDEKSLFSELSYELWIHNHPVEEWINQSNEALEEADKCFYQLKKEITKANIKEEFKNKLIEFSASVEFLSESISVFPSKIEL